MALSDFFVWGQNGQPLTPDEISRRRAIADALMQNASDYSPVASWTQGAARVAQGILGALDDRSLDQSQRAGQASAASDFAAALPGSGISPPSIAAPGFAAAAPASSIPASTGPIAPGDPNDIQTQFLDTAKAGGLTNPYGLAALAATGKSESGWSPKNVNASWADPSQSGQAGTAGGILSWRNERLANLRNFAQANGEDASNISPGMQAKFFLQEDPTLVAGLNAAKSPEEAANLMANAWAFAGYNQPGGEAARRVALTQGYLPQFQGQAAPATAAIQQQSPIGDQQVASLDPSVGMKAPAQAATIPAFDPATATPDQLQAALGPAAPYRDPQVTTAYRQAAPILTPGAVPQVAPQSAASPRQTVAQALIAAPPAPQQINQQAIVKALSNSFISKGQQAVLSGLLASQQAQRQAAYEQQLKQSDPVYQANLQKAQWEVSHLGQVSPDTAATLKAQSQKPVEVNGRLVDPTSGRVIADYSNPQVTAVDGALVDNRTGQPLYRSSKPMNVNGYLVDPNTGQQVADYSSPNVSDVDGALVDQRTGKVIYQGTPKGVTVDPGQTLVNPQTGKVLLQGSGYKPADVTDLRKEIQQLPNYKAYQQAAPVYSSMIDTAKTDSKASDLNLVYGLGKIMDPNSVVREGEMVMVNNTSSLPDWLMGAINSVNGGSKLEPATRSAILREANSRMTAYRGVLDNDLGQYRGIISRRGMNEQDVLPTLNPVAAVPDLTSPQTTAPTTGITTDWREVSPGVRIRKVN